MSVLNIANKIKTRKINNITDDLFSYLNSTACTVNVLTLISLFWLGNALPVVTYFRLHVLAAVVGYFWVICLK